ncbi:helix-turn-helix transcriptional regulator [Puia sp.]|jgi:AraC-like DNA-binding protein|uniref:helix-turn-helix transcriptional regulator n=1 Tax=Puia sp. TaxID=2045100 RepID=UPI002F404B56
MTYYYQELMRIQREHYPCAAVIERCRAAKRLIDERCCGEVDLDGLARGVFVSKFHFIRQFSRVYGRTPYRYLTERRIALAKELLTAGMGVREVCCRVGFSSVPSFASLFKRYIGYSPGKMRNSR